GFFAKKADWPAQYPSIVVAVDDIDESIRKVRDAGGRVLGEPVEIPGVGRYVSFTDTEGNRVSMLRPIPRSSHAPKSGGGRGANDRSECVSLGTVVCARPRT